MNLKETMMRLTGRIPQGHKLYDGRYHDGKATFTYVHEGGKMVFDGDFSFTVKYGGGRNASAKGPFVNDRKNGKWQIRRIGGQTVKWVEADFVDGRLDGRLWCQVEESVIGGSYLKSISISVKDGHPVGAIEGIVNDGELKGAFDESGRPDGEWSLAHPDEDGVIDHIDRELWDHGVLKESTCEYVRSHQKDAQPVGIFQRIRNLIDTDAQQLLDMVRHGVTDQQIRIESE